MWCGRIWSVGVVEEDVVNRGGVEEEDALWRPRIGKAERKRKKERLNEFNNKLLELKFKQTKKDYNMIKNMSNPGSYKLSEKETKKINKDLQKEIKQELIFKTKQEI